ncbi:MAG: branched-chain amino acid ABC transporter permease [Desulfomonile tiedjei]|nr:branched-chain amino acid ABC transporter permease [Desulfomonile tiedjei]
MTNKVSKWVFWLVLVVILAAYPKLFGLYYTNLFVTFAIFALFSVSFNLLLGYTGLLSFGHAMFFGAGGYGTALALKHIEGLALLPAVLIGLLSAAALALILCPLVVRVSGTAFSMLHLAFGELMHVLALKLRNITGGEDGIGGFPIPPVSIPGIVSIDIRQPENFYYFAVVCLGISLLIIWFFTKTPFGQIQIGVRDNAKRIDYLGFKVPQTKAVVYVVSAAFAGVAGSMYALFQNLISSAALNVLTSFAPITITMIGGVGSFFGPIVGSGIFQVIEELTSRYTEQVELVIGLILILVIMFAPMGFMGAISLLKQTWFPSRTARVALKGAS